MLRAVRFGRGHGPVAGYGILCEARGVSCRPGSGVCDWVRDVFREFDQRVWMRF